MIAEVVINRNVKKLNKTFEMDITDEIYEKLRGVTFEQTK